MSKSSTSSPRRVAGWFCALVGIVAAIVGFLSGQLFPPLGPADWVRRDVVEPAKATAQDVPDPIRASVERFVDHYFAVWSTNDMAGYRACFHPKAVISALDGRGQVQTYGLTSFVRTQEAARAADPTMREYPTRKEIGYEAGVARAAVSWTLEKADGPVHGLNLFTLLRTPAGWSILTLTYYPTEAPP